MNGADISQYSCAVFHKKTICHHLLIVFCNQVFHNSLFSGKSWQNPANIDMQWVATIECQCWQDSARIWQKMTNYRKTRLSYSG